MVDNPPDREPPALGERYEIEAFLGEGSTGRVYRAHDRQLARTVAVKVLRSKAPVDLRRFKIGARAQAKLDHEHVCRVFDVGVAGGRGFLAMQHIDGQTLHRLAGELSLDERVALIEQVARAVQSAHTAGVVHRDLKPGNVMVERRPDGGLHAWVLDFGIAHHGTELAGDDAGPSGTAAFMAPEQVRDPGGAPDPRVDVYGLGATLYAVLAEQAPFFGRTRGEVKARVLDDEPLELGLVVPGTPTDLETIVAVAMEKDPARRYPTARAFADDLARWRRGEPIRAAVGGPLGRVAAWLRPHRGPAAALVLVVMLGAVAATGTVALRSRTIQRQALVDHYRGQVEQIDRLLRRARMMPLRETGPAEDEVRRRLATIERDLPEHGPMARGSAAYALGFGHLMLRDFERAETWLQAAYDGGLTSPEVESALGIAQAMRVLRTDRSAGAGHDRNSDSDLVSAAVRHLAASGPETADRDLFHRSLALLVEGRLDDALAAARTSSERVPWLYEATQLEGDILVARSSRRRVAGDEDGAIADLRAAGEAYARGLEIARSDASLYEAEAARLLRLIALDGSRSGADPELVGRAVEMIAAAEAARPRTAALAADELAVVRAQLERLIAESRGADGG
ncbi:MAG: protein kinase [Thermoanaerobaculales bacterium]|jgi:serine/threonine-protein kinase|nr:protein kinase [Thermoanaerobaculales bacterium]